MDEDQKKLMSLFAYVVKTVSLMMMEAGYDLGYECGKRGVPSEMRGEALKQLAEKTISPAIEGTLEDVMKEFVQSSE